MNPTSMLETNPVAVLVLAAGGAALLFLFLGVRSVRNDRIGIVERRFSSKGSIAGGFIALAGEAGFQPDVLRGGLHFLMPLMYRVHTMPLVTIPQGRLGYVFARDGLPLAADQALGKEVNCSEFQDVAGFLRAGGQRGPQRRILREGTYAINLAQFVVITMDRIHYLALDKDDEGLFKRMQELIAQRSGFQPVVLVGDDDLIGVVTVHDGPALPQGEIIAAVVGQDPADLPTFHNSFQEPERFLAAGGRRGRQLHVLVEGTYFLNRLFATVEAIQKTIVDVGYVGVVVSYTGDAGTDLSGEDYKHGELVERGHRGVWAAPLLPGKYAFNTFAGKVVMVPTTNFILKWNKAEIGPHGYDENLTEVSLITKDAFEPSLPLSVVVHIDYKKAPRVVQRFGDVKRLVEQTLDPMVAAYFKNVGQTRTLIQLLQDRSAIQRIASEEMKEKFDRYNLELEECLIGTPVAAKGDNHIATILEQLRMRQIAEEQVETYARKERAAIKERELREAESRAKQQTVITESELSISIQKNQGRAEYERAVQEASRIRAIAEAEADKVRRMAEAEAERAARVGVAQAIAIEEQVRAYGGPELQLTQNVLARFSEAVEKSGVEIVPRVVVSGGAGGTSGGPGQNAFEALLAILLADRAGEKRVTAVSTTGPNPMAARIREELAGALGRPTNGGGGAKA